MKYNRLSFLSVLVAIGVLPGVSDAGIRVGNASRSNAQGYQQVNDTRYQQPVPEAKMAPVDLPINVTNQQLAQQIQSGDANAPVTVDQLDRCKMIYPNGEFEWARPTIGMGAGGAPTCTSVVELRVIGQGENGGDLIVARANLAAGDSFDCNISKFPEAAWLTAAGNVEFPADKQPTVEDVKKIMDEEQKQNAAIKIIGGTVLGGIFGNMAGDNEAGKDGILGGGKDKITGTIAGAVGGAGLMAASSYSGKVAGDMIMSTGINAAAGAVMGNVVASGDSVMRIEDCEIDNVETTCLWGYLEEAKNITTDEKAYVLTTGDSDFMLCNFDRTGCRIADLTGVTVTEYQGRTKPGDGSAYTLQDIAKDNYNLVKNKYCLTSENEMIEEASRSVECKDDSRYAALSDASLVSKRTPAMLTNVQDSNFGYKSSDWDKVKQLYGKNAIVGRSGNGEASILTEDQKKLGIANFKPMYRDASDGGIIDLSNKARLKGTLTGAGVGGAAGAFTAYQGAQSEIDERWVSAVREYKDSLQKFYCGTGKRFLSFYNDIAVIPNQN